MPVAPCPTCSTFLEVTSDWCYGCGRIFDPRELWDQYETEQLEPHREGTA